MKPIFVDTSALIAIGNRRDSFHSQAVSVRNELKQIGSFFITTNQNQAGTASNSNFDKNGGYKK